MEIPFSLKKLVISLNHLQNLDNMPTLISHMIRIHMSFQKLLKLHWQNSLLAMDLKMTKSTLKSKDTKKQWRLLWMIRISKLSHNLFQSFHIRKCIHGWQTHWQSLTDNYLVVKNTFKKSKPHGQKIWHKEFIGNWERPLKSWLIKILTMPYYKSSSLITLPYRTEIVT